MAARRIVFLATYALGALLIHPHSPIVVVDAQLSSVDPPQFPHGSVNVGGLNTNPPAVPGTHSGSGDAWSVSGSTGDIWVSFPIIFDLLDAPRRAPTAVMYLVRALAIMSIFFYLSPDAHSLCRGILPHNYIDAFFTG
jgi:hypothetical protein